METPEIDTRDQPTTTSWSNDWKQAERKAKAFEEKFNGNASKQKREQPADEGPDDDGAREPEADGKEEGLEEASGSEGRTSKPRQRAEERGRESSDVDEGPRNASRKGRVRRGVRVEEQASPVEEQEPEDEDEDEPEQGEPEGDSLKESKGRPKRHSEADSEELAQFKAQAKKLGFDIDERQVAKQERISLRKERKEVRMRLAEQQQEVEQVLAQKASDLEAKYERAHRLQRAIEEDDLNGIAQAAGYKDWTEINKAFLNKQLNPQHKEMTALRRQLREREEREAAQQKEHLARQQNERRLAQEREYKRDLQDDISDLEDKALAQFSDDPMFVDAVLHHQRRAFDGVETISVREAAKLAYDDARKLYETLHARFGGRATSKPGTSANGTAVEEPAEATGKRRNPPKTVSQSQVADASENEDPNMLDERAWARKWSREIANSTSPS
jgi:hypothetical protein